MIRLQNFLTGRRVTSIILTLNNKVSYFYIEKCTSKPNDLTETVSWQQPTKRGIQHRSVGWLQEMRQPDKWVKDCYGGPGLDVKNEVFNPSKE